MSIFHRVVEKSCSNESCWMSHVYHKKSPYLVGNFTHTLVIPFAAICRATTDDELRLVFECETFHLVIVDTSCFWVEVVAHGVVEDT